MALSWELQEWLLVPLQCVWFIVYIFEWTPVTRKPRTIGNTQAVRISALPWSSSSFSHFDSAIASSAVLRKLGEVFLYAFSFPDWLLSHLTNSRLTRSSLIRRLLMYFHVVSIHHIPRHHANSNIIHESPTVRFRIHLPSAWFPQRPFSLSDRIQSVLHLLALSRFVFIFRQIGVSTVCLFLLRSNLFISHSIYIYSLKLIKNTIYHLY